MKKHIFIIIFLIIPTLFYGWRSYIRSHIGSDANGIGGAYVGDATSELALFYNPAGLVQLKGENEEQNFFFLYEVSASLLLYSYLSWDPAFKFDTFPFLAIAYTGLNWKMGLSIASSFESESRLNDFRVRDLFFSISIPIENDISIGFGAGPIFAIENTTTGYSFSYNIGILWNIEKDLKFGLCFHSPFAIQWNNTEAGNSLYESFPFLLETGLAYQLSEVAILFTSLDYIDIDSIRYVLDEKDYSPTFDQNLFARVHPHIGIRFLEENTGAHISAGFMMDSSYYDNGSINQYLITLGVRAYGKNMIFRASLIDALLIGLFYRGNVKNERINISFGFYF